MSRTTILLSFWRLIWPIVEYFGVVDGSELNLEMRLEPGPVFLGGLWSTRRD